MCLHPAGRLQSLLHPFLYLSLSKSCLVFVALEGRRQSDASTFAVRISAKPFMNIPPHGCIPSWGVGKHDGSTFVFSSVFVPSEQTLKVPLGKRATRQR